MADQINTKDVSEFIGEMREWKRSFSNHIDHTLESILKRLDEVVTAKEFQSKHSEQQKEIELLKIKVANQGRILWLVSVLAVGGEFVLHHLEWFVGIAKSLL